MRRRVLVQPLLLVGVVASACSPPAATPTIAPTATSQPAAKPGVAPSVSVSQPSPSPIPPSPSPTQAVAAAATSTPAAVAVTASRVETLVAANTAFERADSATAAQLYERVVNTPPSPGEAAQLSSAIDGFARFRAMVSLLALGRETEARQQLDALQARDETAPFARLAAQLWDQYSMTGQLRAACTQLRPQVESQAGPTLAALQAAGVTINPNTLCSPAQGGGY